MTIREKKTYICDRCGHETNNSDDKRHHESGCLTLKYSGHQGGMSFGGDWGGANIKGEKWLCLDCTKSFLQWIKPPGDSV